MSSPMRKSESEMRNAFGFTLVELIIVIAIISILAAAIFVAIDPARRLHESRNARRSTDVATILEAIKTYQADNDGTHLASINAMVDGNYYQIGTEASGCAGLCGELTMQDACVDLSGIGSNYLAKIPYDPSTGSDTATRYSILKDFNGAISVIACDSEGEDAGGNGQPPDIRVVR